VSEKRFLIKGGDFFQIVLKLALDERTQSMSLKNLPGFFDSGMLQLFKFELLLFDHVIPRGWQAL
jgi:hypothetical protein